MIFGFIKPYVDVHTLGIYSVVGLLESCGYKAFVAPARVCLAVDRLFDVNSFYTIKKWVIENSITSIGFSYRLDPVRASAVFSSLVEKFDRDQISQETCRCNIHQFFFSGLPYACDLVQQAHGKRVLTFSGDETPIESLKKLGVPEYLFPNWLRSQDQYDKQRWEFARNLIYSGQYQFMEPLPHCSYGSYLKSSDTVIARLKALQSYGVDLPLLRAHVGPYLANKEEAMRLYCDWLKDLATSRHLDIVSIGSSQLTQEKFGENWDGLENGGGVPIQSEIDFFAAKHAGNGLLMRAYSATKNIPSYAEMLEKTINNAWHALSLWWFNQSDGRGPLTVYDSLCQHVDTMKLIAKFNKPFEPNIAHHFSFRGADDLTSIVATFLAVKLAQRLGIRFIILQAMLNTPKAISGVSDLIKFKALLLLCKSLEHSNFKVILQPRAGLAYFSPDIEKAKIQLASVSAMMADIESKSPSIVHVVSYSEAVKLADPIIIDDSAKITRFSIKNYLGKNINKEILTKSISDCIETGVQRFLSDAVLMIKHMEHNYPDLYSADGFYKIYKAGYFAVPQLWECRDEFTNAVNWQTKMVNGTMVIVDKNSQPIPIKSRLALLDQLRFLA